ncbi:MAG: SpoIIE family protein phosphatase [Melioribacteraceae bacterium]|nr:SpoIIE family protein phosphatase [Melioribacteraceae bacterium]MCF8353789.1 SpoIIE family protein phosphatase [Melioribacteraceae bacterium]MCF8393625.1 SpoIIE family protein phosphatase [Melioribacteraceae bacterium]MCF8419435.1 SpoIIE family protein phosphatase [Melioribacteraceae bacterium]
MQKIIAGEYEPGDDLLPSGLVAREQQVSKNTVNRAYEILIETGLVEKVDGNGYKLIDVDGEILKSIAEDYLSAHENEISIKSDEYNKYAEELQLARQIQSDLLPDKNYDDESLRIVPFISPSHVVCGDFYDYFKIDENKIGIVIADASGKGMPAAILISQIQAILKSEIANGSTLIKIFQKLNHHLINNTSARNFTTLFYGIFDRRTSVLSSINAGHNYPIILHKNGSFELIKTNAPALGLIKSFSYTVSTHIIVSGDTMVLYTDGITETMNELGEQYGEGRLLEITEANKDKEPDKISEIIRSDVDRFKSEKNMSDDKTLVIIKVKNRKEN